MDDDDLCALSVHELSGRIRRREVSPVEVVEAHLRRIADSESTAVGLPHRDGEPRARRGAARRG